MFRVEIKAHSIDERGNELLTVSATFPRIILAEINTHRMLSKNTSSSRAIPFEKMVQSVEENPFIPIAWQKNHKGMQGTEYLTAPIDIAFAHDIWLEGRDRAIKTAKALNNKDFVTKQLCNRLLEPFMWTTMLITGPVKSGWDNFFNLRCNSYVLTDDKDKTTIFKSKKEVLADGNWYIRKDDQKRLGKMASEMTELDWLILGQGQGEIHIMKIAEMIYDALQESKPIFKREGEWHIPYFNDYHLAEVFYNATVDELVKISTSKAARESYTVVGNEVNVPFEKHIELYEKLVAYEPPHSSPLEHVGKSMSDKEYISYFRGELPDEDNLELMYSGRHGWCRNFKGFIPLRHIIEAEV